MLIRLLRACNETLQPSHRCKGADALVRKKIDKFRLDLALFQSGMEIAYEPGMEPLAITNWNGIVSPMFDASCCLMIVQPDGRRFFIDVRNMTLFEKIDLCSKRNVRVIICGAISNLALSMLQDSDIRILSWVRGPIEDIVNAYVKNLNIVDLFSMPGCSKKMCGKKRRIRQHGDQWKKQ